MSVARLLLAIGVALALADASVVTLALPPVLVDLDTTVEGVAAVIGIYTSCSRRCSRWRRGCAGAARTRRPRRRRLRAASRSPAGCARRPKRSAGLLAFRALQAAGAAAALVASFALLGSGRLWTTAAVFGTAVGPALGGALTQAFDWRAIFIFQVLPALAAAAATSRRPRGARCATGGAPQAAGAGGGPPRAPPAAVPARTRVGCRRRRRRG